MVGLVLVSHSEALAQGLAELAGQMAADVAIRPAGGTDDGRIGTSLEKVMAAIEEADDGDGVVVLYDLGSALMTAESAVEFLDDDARARVRVVDAPLVEAAVAAATTAAGRASLDQVVAAARSAAGGGAEAPQPAPPAQPDGGGVERTVTLVNKLGIHARTAADIVRLAQSVDADVRIARTDGAEHPVSARSVLLLVGLCAMGGTTLRVTASGPGAAEAADSMADLLASGFGEELI